MKKLAMLVLSIGLLLSGCSPGFQKEEKKSNKSKESAIVPKYSISDDYYKTIIPFKPSASRGLVVQGLNNRLDIDEFETGLMRIASESFPTKDYLFQGGQYLDKKTVQALVARKKSPAEQKDNKKNTDLGLNPYFDKDAPGSAGEKNKKSPIYLSNILEHDYLVKKGDNSVELGGVVIGLAMNSVHYYNQEQGYPREYNIPTKDLLGQGKKMAQSVLDTLRKNDKLKDVPIVFALYQQEAKSSLVPGNFLTYVKVDKGETKIDGWDNLDEQYCLFPSAKASENYREDATKVSNFRADISKYFQNDFTAVVGQGFYKDGQLQELKLDIPVQFGGKAEVIGFTQYVTGLIMTNFPNYIKVEVNIHSVNQPEAIISREVNQQKPYVHIFN